MTSDELVLNNQKLITYTLKSLNITYNFEELYSIAQIGLVKASKYYDPSKGAFSSYAMKIMKNEIFYRTRKKQLKTVSLSTEIKDNLDLEDVIADDYSFEKDIETKDYISNLLESLSKKERDYIIKYFGLFGTESQNSVEMAKELNITHQAVSNIIQKAIKKLKMVVNK